MSKIKRYESALNKRIKSFLLKLDVKELKRVQVAIKRSFIPEPDRPVPLEYSLGDPEELVIHRPGEGLRPIFDRDDVVVNYIDSLEERIVISSNDVRSSRSRSKERSESSYRSSKKRSRSRSHSTSPEKKHCKDKPTPSHRRRSISSDRSLSVSPHRKPYRYRDPPGTYPRRSPKRHGYHDRDSVPRRSRSPLPREGGYRGPSSRNEGYRPPVDRPSRYKPPSREDNSPRDGNTASSEKRLSHFEKGYRGSEKDDKSQDYKRNNRDSKDYHEKEKNDSKSLEKDGSRRSNESERRNSEHEPSHSKHRSPKRTESYRKRESPERRRDRSPYQSSRRSKTPDRYKGSSRDDRRRNENSPHHDRYRSRRSKSPSYYRSRRSKSLEGYRGSSRSERHRSPSPGPSERKHREGGYRGPPPHMYRYELYPSGEYWPHGPQIMPRPGMPPPMAIPQIIYRPPYPVPMAPHPRFPRFRPPPHPLPQYNNRRLVIPDVSSTTTSSTSTTPTVSIEPAPQSAETNSIAEVKESVPLVEEPSPGQTPPQPES